MSGPITEDGKSSLPSYTETDLLINADENKEASMALPLYLQTSTHCRPETRIRVVWRRVLNGAALVVSGVAMSVKHLPGGTTVFNGFSLVLGVLTAIMYDYRQCIYLS